MAWSLLYKIQTFNSLIMDITFLDPMIQRKNIWWVFVEIVIGFVCSAIGIALGFFVLKFIFFVLSHMVQK
jgi:hypothetical protein